MFFLVAVPILEGLQGVAVGAEGLKIFYGVVIVVAVDVVNVELALVFGNETTAFAGFFAVNPISALVVIASPAYGFELAWPSPFASFLLYRVPATQPAQRPVLHSTPQKAEGCARLSARCAIGSEYPPLPPLTGPLVRSCFSPFGGLSIPPLDGGSLAGRHRSKRAIA